MKRLCAQLPLIQESYIVSASHILKAVTAYLCLERMVAVRQEELPIQLDAYIISHLSENPDASALCRHFQIGKTSLYDIARRRYGMGISEHIRHLRIARAQTLLIEHQEMRISEISAVCGFPDYNYFSTVFKRISGMTPSQFRAVKSTEH